MTSAATVEGLIEIAKSIQQRAEQHLAEDGFVTPITFLFLRKDWRTGEVFLDPQMFILTPDRMHGHDEKDIYAKFLHHAIKVGNGIAVLNLMECWTADGSEEKGLEWLAGHGSLKDFPGRKEKVALALEHQDLHEGVMWLAEIIRVDGEAPRLGPWVAEPMIMGRFAEFFNKPMMA